MVSTVLKVHSFGPGYTTEVVTRQNDDTAIVQVPHVVVELVGAVYLKWVLTPNEAESLHKGGLLDVGTEWAVSVTPSKPASGVSK